MDSNSFDTGSDNKSIFFKTKVHVILEKTKMKRRVRSSKSRLKISVICFCTKNENEIFCECTRNLCGICKVYCQRCFQHGACGYCTSLVVCSHCENHYCAFCIEPNEQICKICRVTFGLAWISKSVRLWHDVMFHVVERFEKHVWLV